MRTINTDRKLRTAIAVSSIALIAAGNAVAGNCRPQWQNAGTELQNATIYDMVVFDDGTGPALYVGGVFQVLNGAASHIARWDGSSWSVVGPDPGGAIHALAVYDDGTGPALYAAGMTKTVIKYQNGQWDHIGMFSAGFSMPELYSLTVHEEPGKGPALYVGGFFTEVNFSIPAFGVARWDGAEWSALPGSNSGVQALDVYESQHDDEPMLYAGFNGLSRWNGTSWSSVGIDGSVRALAAADSLEVDSGPVLYVGGWFTSTGGQSGLPVNCVARWDGQTWSALGEGVTRETGTARVHALAMFDDGNGPALYVGGYFDSAGGAPANNIARWDGAQWSTLGAGVNQSGDQWMTPAETLSVFDDGDGPALYVGGSFTGAPSMENYLTKWQGCPVCIAPDLNCDGVVDVSDLLLLLAAWGQCPTGEDCPADMNGDGVVDVSDLLILLSMWG